MRVMSNATPIRTHVDATRATRADFVHDALKSERWSVRQAALALGMTHSVLNSRVNGETSFFAEELESIAMLLRREPVEFYAEYLAAGTKKGPDSGVSGPSLPHLDSNQEPIGSQSHEGGELITVTFGGPGSVEHDFDAEIIEFSVLAQ